MLWRLLVLGLTAYFTIYFILSLHHSDYHKMTDNNVSLPILQSLRMNINLCILLCIRWELKTVMKTSRMSKNTRRSMILILNQLSTYLKCIFTQWKKMKKILSNCKNYGPWMLTQLLRLSCLHVFKPFFNSRAKLFRYDTSEDTPVWKERGTGEIKVLYHLHKNTARVLMRRDKTWKICANHYSMTCSVFGT